MERNRLGTDGNTYYASVEVPPVPEPGTLFLLGASACVGLAGWRRRKKIDG